MLRLTVETAGMSALTDLGRLNSPQRGVQTNGAADQTSATAANILVGNPETEPLVEITAVMPTRFRVSAHALVAVTGAATELLVDGIRYPSHQGVIVWPGAVIEVPPANAGLRAYLAVHGSVQAPQFFGSVAFDPLLGTSTFLADGQVFDISGGRLARVPDIPWLSAQAPRLPEDGGDGIEVGMLPGPETHEFPQIQELFAAAGAGTANPASDSAASPASNTWPHPAASTAPNSATCPGFEYTVSEQSDHVGLRLVGSQLERTSRSEILSRGVPVGTVEVPPAGEPIVLLRGRPLTAGYPIIGVIGRGWHDVLGQLGPGDRLRLRPCTPAESLARTSSIRHSLNDLTRAARPHLSRLRFS